MICSHHLGGDVWAWTKEIRDACPGCPASTKNSLLINGAATPVERVGEAFSAVVSLHTGENEVVAVSTAPYGTIQGSSPVNYVERLQPRPTARLSLEVEGDQLLIHGTTNTPSDYDGASLANLTLTSRGDNLAVVELEGEESGIWVAPVPATDGEYEVSLKVEDEKGRAEATAANIILENGRARVPDQVHERAGWIADAVVYGVVPLFFKPPNFKGVAARLDDLADLGVTALWFSPITRSLPGDFGYAVTDYFDLRPEYGSKADFKALVDAAHVRGLRVLMDFVPNHTSAAHPYFRDAEANGEASTYWDFYDRDAGGNATHYFDWSHLPNLNYHNHEVRRFMLEAFRFWVREFDVDGFRVDAVWGIKKRRPEWIADLLVEMYRLKPDLLLIAEASARDAFYFDVGFDAAYDWTDELGHWAWGNALGGIAPIGAAMMDALTDSGRGYHRDALVMRFLNNNDTGARFLTSYGVDFYRVALAMLLTLPGLPCLFTGDEVGAEFRPYEQAGIGPIDWTDLHGLRPDTKKLIALRRSTPALHSLEWQPLTVDPAAPSFAYLRTVEGAQPVIVVLNFSPADLEAVVSLPELIAELFRSAELFDLWSGEAIGTSDGSRLNVSIPRWGFRFVSGGHG